MGLLDDQTQQGGLLGFLQSPAGQGLLSAGFAGLSGAGRLRPWNLAGAAGSAGLQGYQQATENQNANSLKNIQLQQAQQAMERQKQILQLQKQFATPAGGAAMGAVAAQGNTAGGFDGQGNYTAPVNNLGPTNAAAAVAPQAKPAFDYSGYADALASIDPMAAMQIKAGLQKDTPFNKLDPKDFEPASVAAFSKSGNYADLRPRSKKEFAPNGQLVDVYSTPQGSAFSDPNQPFTTGSNGEPVPNMPYQQYQLSKAKAGASNTSVKVENRMGESLAGQVGPMVKDSYTAALGAIQTADAANRVLQAASSGKLISGPMADTRMTVAQMADTLGMGGADTAEKIANTRAAIRGLSEMTLQGRKQMSGQGAITESESKLAERAMSGDISMTAAEIRQLANAARRAAQFTYDLHQSQLKNMDQDQSLGGLSKFYRVPAFPAAVGSPVVDHANDGTDDLVNKYRSR